MTGFDDDAVPAPDPEATQAAGRRRDELGSLGRLADLWVWAAGVQGRCPPRPFGRVRVVLLAGDHGITAAGVSTHPAGTTMRLVDAVLSGAAPVCSLARSAGAGIRVLDLAVDGPTPASIGQHKVCLGSGQIDRVDALTEAEARQAYNAGRQIADEEVDAGADLLVPAELGVGSATAAATIVSVLTGAEPVEVMSPGGAIDDDTWMRRLAAVRDARRRVRGRSDPLTLLAVAGGADLAAMAGLLSQSAVRRTPVLLDGALAAAAALLAREATPAAVAWWLAAQRSTEPAADLAFDRLDLAPALDLGVRLGQGAGALLALPVLNTVLQMVAETPA